MELVYGLIVRKIHLLHYKFIKVRLTLSFLLENLNKICPKFIIF